jgi:predicted peptidase
MKHLPALLLACIGLVISSGPLDARTWTAADGRKMEADFVGVENGKVQLLKGGQKMSVPLEKLSAEDQKWATEEAAKQPTPKTPPATKPAGPTKPIDPEYAALLTGDWALAKHEKLPYAFYGAKELDPAKTYPLILSLHGKSDNDENGPQVGGWTKIFTTKEKYDKNPCLIVAPLCYQPYGGTGGGWGDKPGTEALDLVETLIKKLPLIDKDRIYVIGYSMGGFGTCHLINKEPKLFAAGIPVAGYGSASAAFKKVPMWLFHAADDEVVKVGGSQSLAKAMDNVKTFKYTEFPTGGHGIIGKVFDDPAVHEWLFQQKR